MIVPNGIVAFFPSYRYMEHTIAAWNDMGLLASILKHKLLFVETDTLAEVTPKVLSFFFFWIWIWIWIATNIDTVYIQWWRYLEAFLIGRRVYKNDGKMMNTFLKFFLKAKFFFFLRSLNLPWNNLCCLKIPKPFFLIKMAFRRKKKKPQFPFFQISQFWASKKGPFLGFKKKLGKFFKNSFPPPF